MNEQPKIQCPECADPDSVGRREFLMAAGGTAVTLASLQFVPQAVAQETGRGAAPAARQTRPAEALIRELYSGLTEEQRGRVVLPWNHGAGANAVATRLRMYNASLNQNTIGAVYTRAQKELNERILRAISSDEEGYRRVTRNGTFDQSGSFDRCGAHIFGDPTGNQQFAWVFSGHHLTVRCDGNSEPDAAFGGPMYYGHSPDGYSQRNVWNYQTRAVLSVWDALSEAQRRTATMANYVNPREQMGSVQFRANNHPGLAYRDMTGDQKTLVQTVMRNLLNPFRAEDGDEVMELIRRNGGMDRIHLGFFRDANTEAGKWNFWRLEGPGFVWNYRILDHVHCFVNIARRETT
jgi:Protein of unknown function (DUF3500)